MELQHEITRQIDIILQYLAYNCCNLTNFSDNFCFEFSGLNFGLNSTFNKGPVRRLESTFSKDSSPALNSTFEIGQDLVDRHHNGTFNTKPTTSSASLLHQQHNATFDISNNATFEVIRNHSQDNDDRLSSTSDSSVSHRLNDLGDVQHLARMQEESKFSN